MVIYLFENTFGLSHLILTWLNISYLMAIVVTMKILVDLNWERKDTILYTKQTADHTHYNVLNLISDWCQRNTVVLVIYSSYVL